MNIEGIDSAIGLKSCNQSMETYLIILDSVHSEANDKIQLLQSSYDNEDYKCFGIVAHGLKGMAASIGAMQLSMFAYSLEQAGLEGDSDYIKRHGEELISAYQKLRNNLKIALTERNMLGCSGEFEEWQE